LIEDDNIIEIHTP